MDTYKHLNFIFLLDASRTLKSKNLDALLNISVPRHPLFRALRMIYITISVAIGQWADTLSLRKQSLLICEREIRYFHIVYYLRKKSIRYERKETRVSRKKKLELVRKGKFERYS